MVTVPVGGEGVRRAVSPVLGPTLCLSANHKKMPEIVSLPVKESLCAGARGGHQWEERSG